MSSVSSRAGATPPQRQHIAGVNGWRRLMPPRLGSFNRCRAKMSQNPAPHVTALPSVRAVHT